MTLIEQMDEIVLHIKGLTNLNKKMSCGSPRICGYHEPEIQIYQGIKKMATAVGKELIKSKVPSTNPTAHFIYNGVKFYQLGECEKIRKAKYL